MLHHINTELGETISSIIKKYPQNNSNKASLRIKKAVFKIDNRADDSYDFLYANGLSFYYR
jgi:hypothetical protein